MIEVIEKYKIILIDKEYEPKFIYQICQDWLDTEDGITEENFVHMEDESIVFINGWKCVLRKTDDNYMYPEQSGSCKDCNHLCGLQELGGGVRTAPYCPFILGVRLSQDISSMIIGQDLYAVDYRTFKCNNFKPKEKK